MALTMLTESINCHDHSSASQEDNASVCASENNSKNLIGANKDQSRLFNDLFSIAMVSKSFDPITLAYNQY